MGRDHYHGRELGIAVTCLSEQESVPLPGKERCRGPLESHIYVLRNCIFLFKQGRNKVVIGRCQPHSISTWTG